ncbi:MAG: sulfatase [Candidatus Hydrogenedentota bacterium]
MQRVNGAAYSREVRHALTRIRRWFTPRFTGLTEEIGKRVADNVARLQEMASRFAARGVSRPCAVVAASLVLLLAANAAGGERPDGGEKDQPNVILLMFDDLGYDDVGYHDSGHYVQAQTPNIDEMAESSLVFERFYAGAPVCSPTRGSALTGRHPFRYGVFHANTGHLPEDELNLAEELKQEGYQTGHFGKWHLGTLTTEVEDSNRGRPGHTEHFAPPWERSFDAAFSTEAKVPTYNPTVRPADFSDHPGNLQHWWDPDIEEDNIQHYGTHYWDESGGKVTENVDGPNAEVIMDRAIPFIENAVEEEDPFLAVVWFHEPHWPVVAGADHAGQFPELKEFGQHYYGCISHADEQVGRLREALRDLGVADNTMFWLTSDNGPEGGQTYPGSAAPLRGRKRDLYEGGIRVPALLEWPARISEQRMTDMPAVTHDYLPTIAEVLDIELPPNRPLDGISLVPLINGEMNERPEPIAFQFEGRLALSGNRYKLVHYPSNRDGRFAAPPWNWELYDLTEDVSESNDLAGEEPEIVERMSEYLMQWNDSVRASLEEVEDNR